MDIFKCKTCEKEFNNLAALVSHLSNKRNTCKTNIKEYYDKYYRKENEGICKFCGRETLFSGLGKGYLYDTCKHCKNKNQMTQEKRKKTYLIKKEIKDLEKEKIKIENGYYELPVECEICKDKNVSRRFKNKISLAKHIGLAHREIKLQDYYDKYFKTDPNEGICPITGKKTILISLQDGYKKYYGKGTGSSDPAIKEKVKKTMFKNYGVDFPCYVKSDQRISNYKNTTKKRIDLNNERNKLINILKRMSIDKNDKFQCQICGSIFKTYREISSHVVQSHKIIIKTYYDKFFKKMMMEFVVFLG